jgi:hypothetical protein
MPSTEVRVRSTILPCIYRRTLTCLLKANCIDLVAIQTVCAKVRSHFLPMGNALMMF